MQQLPARSAAAAAEAAAAGQTRRGRWAGPAPLQLQQKPALLLAGRLLLPPRRLLLPEAAPHCAGAGPAAPIAAQVALPAPRPSRAAPQPLPLAAPGATAAGCRHRRAKRKPKLQAAWVRTGQSRPRGALQGRCSCPAAGRAGVQAAPPAARCCCCWARCRPLLPAAAAACAAGAAAWRALAPQRLSQPGRCRLLVRLLLLPRLPLLALQLPPWACARAACPHLHVQTARVSPALPAAAGHRRQLWRRHPAVHACPSCSPTPHSECCPAPPSRSAAPRSQGTGHVWACPQRRCRRRRHPLLVGSGGPGTPHACGCRRRRAPRSGWLPCHTTRTLWPPELLPACPCRQLLPPLPPPQLRALQLHAGCPARWHPRCCCRLPQD